VAAGFGYHVKDGAREYNTVKSMNIRKFAFATDISHLTNNWNVQIHHWLKYYVMMRLLDRKKPRGSFQAVPVMITFVVSAVWHGTYPGFFILFTACIFIQITSKNVGSSLKNVEFPKVFHLVVEPVILWLWAFVITGYYSCAFIFLEYDFFVTYSNNWH